MWVWAKHYQPFVNKRLMYFRRAKGDKLKLPSQFFRGGYDTYVDMWNEHWKMDKANYTRYGKFAKWKWAKSKHILPYKEWLKHARKYAAIDRRRYIAQQKRKKLLNKK